MIVNTKCIIKGDYTNIKWCRDINILWVYIVNEIYYMKELWRLWKDEYTCLRLVIDWIPYNCEWFELIILSTFLECLWVSLGFIWVWESMHSFEKAKKEILRFGKVRKIESEIRRLVWNCRKGRPLAYKLELLRKLLSNHDVFHVFILKWYR